MKDMIALSLSYARGASGSSGIKRSAQLGLPGADFPDNLSPLPPVPGRGGCCVQSLENI